MAISKYFDSKIGTECFKVRVVKKSSGKKGIVVDRSQLGFRTLADALKAEKKLTNEVQREMFTSEIKEDSWRCIVDEWYEAASSGNIFTGVLKKSSIEDYRAALVNHTDDWMGRRIDEIDKSMVWLKMDELDRKFSSKHRKKVRTAIDNVYKWGMVSGRINVSSIPTEGFKSNRKDEDSLPEILNLDEIRLLLKLAKQLDHKWYPVWALALYTGMRSGELFALRWSSVDFDNAMIYVHEGWTNKNGFGPTKGRYWRSVPISDNLVGFLKEVRLKTFSTGFVLPRFETWEAGSQAQVLRRFCIGTGLPSIKFHTLRSCFATQLIKDGVAPAIVMKMAGWKDLKTMQRYIRLAGIEVKGATNGLKLLPEEEVMGQIVNMFEG